jgi:hypothetical protein
VRQLRKRVRLSRSTEDEGFLRDHVLEHLPFDPRLPPTQPILRPPIDMHLAVSARCQEDLRMAPLKTPFISSKKVCSESLGVISGCKGQVDSSRSSLGSYFYVFLPSHLDVSMDWFGTSYEHLGLVDWSIYHRSPADSVTGACSTWLKHNYWRCRGGNYLLATCHEEVIRSHHIPSPKFNSYP